MKSITKRIESLEKSIPVNIGALIKMCFFVEAGKPITQEQKKILPRFKKIPWNNGYWYWPKKLTIDDLIIAFSKNNKIPISYKQLEKNN